MVEFGPHFNVVVGPNEAGKSTVTSALLATLYGFGRGDKDMWRPCPGRALDVARLCARRRPRVRSAPRLRTRWQRHPRVRRAWQRRVGRVLGRKDREPGARALGDSARGVRQRLVRGAGRRRDRWCARRADHARPRTRPRRGSRAKTPHSAR